jgi:hypothetical protein
MRLQKITKAWFDYPGDEDGARFEIKHLLAGDVAKIVGQTHKRRFEFKPDANGELKPMPVFETDDLLDKQLTLCAVIVGWKNVKDESGKTLDCTEANIIRLCNETEEANHNAFVSFVSDCRATLTETAKSQTEQEKKT